MRSRLETVAYGIGFRNFENVKPSLKSSYFKGNMCKPFYLFYYETCISHKA